jgi:hypothetical protein
MSVYLVLASLPFVLIFTVSGKCEVALFGDYVHDLKKKMLKSSGCLPIVVVQFAKIKTFRGNIVF